MCAERAAALGRPVFFYEVGPDRPARPFLEELAVLDDVRPLASRCR
jgi:hypothetical protein